MTSEDAAWISEAIVEFLRSPLYQLPLMAFIDEKCLIFTPEEENKLEYTTIHEEFKELVDKLLTDLLSELGINPEKFIEIISAAKEDDMLTGFVVQTILTVDDFLLFKAMMVKRNSDLTHQILGLKGGNMMEDLGPEMCQITPEEVEALAKVLALSSSLNTEQREADAIVIRLRSFQQEDEDEAMIVAVAASMKDLNHMESELAELNQAIALSLALEAERARMLAAGTQAPSKSEGEKKALPASSTSAAKPAAPAASKPAAAAPPAAAGASASAAGSKSAAPSSAPKPVAAPFRGDELDGVKPADMAAMREAATKKLEAQKVKVAELRSEVPEEQAKWLQDQKVKLVAAKKVDRQKELDDYKKSLVAESGKAARASGLLPQIEKADPEAEREAKKAALRAKLSQKFKQDLVPQ